MLGYGLLFHGYFNWSQCSDSDVTIQSLVKYYFAAILDHLCKILAMFRASSIPQCSRPSNFIPRLLNTSSRVPFRSLLKVSVQFSQINPLCGILGYGNGAEIALTWEETLHIIRATLEKKYKGITMEALETPLSQKSLPPLSPHLE